MTAISFMQPLRHGLVRRFVALSRDSEAHRARVLRECAMLVDHDIFPFAFPHLGICAGHLEARVPTHEARAACERLVAQSHLTMRSHFGPESTWSARRGNGVYFGWYALQLAIHRRTFGECAHMDTLEPVLASLLADLEENAGAPIDSFPRRVWPFDTLPPLAALHLATGPFAERERARIDRAIEAHHAWIAARGTHAPSGLPLSWVGRISSATDQAPRGCDLALRVLILSLYAPSEARALYARFAPQFHREYVLLAGFREYLPGDRSGADGDSGPILFGIGMAASAFGLGASAYASDGWATLRAVTQFAHLSTFARIAALAGRLTAPLLPERLAQVRELLAVCDPASHTGFLYGDCCLLLTLSLPQLAAQHAARD